MLVQHTSCYSCIIGGVILGVSPPRVKRIRILRLMSLNVNGLGTYRRVTEFASRTCLVNLALNVISLFARNTFRYRYGAAVYANVATQFSFCS